VAAASFLPGAPYGGINWTELGPKPINEAGNNCSGRVTAMAFDLGNDPSGNTLYVGGAFGGVWKSTNAQSTSPAFIAIGDNLPSLSVGSITLDSSTNPATVWVGTGEPNLSLDSYYGVGIAKTTNDGATWSLVSSADGGTNPFFGLSISNILKDPTTPSVFLAAAGRAVPMGSSWTSTPPARGIFRSTDGGVTWSLVLNLSHGADALVYDLPQAAYYCAISTLGIYKSTNQGATWTACATPFTASVAPSATNFYRASLATRGTTVYAVIADSSGNFSTPSPGTDTGLVQSTDGGSTWTPIGTACSNSTGGNSNCGATGQICGFQGSYNLALAAPAGGSGLILSLSQIYSTTLVNGVSTVWTNLTGFGPVHVDQHALAVQDPNHWIAGNDGGVWGTSDGGSTFRNMNASLGLTQFTSVSPDGVQAGSFVGGSQDNGTELTNSGVMPQWTWIQDADGGNTAADPAQSVDYLMETQYVSLNRYDGGTTTGIVGSATIPDPSEFYVPFELWPAAGAFQTLLGTTRVWTGAFNVGTPGAGWHAISPALSSGGYAIKWLDASPTNSSVIYAATEDSQIFKTVDALAGSPTWSSVTQANLPAGRPYAALAVHPTDANQAVLGVQNLDPGQQVFKTSDGGTTWTNISGNLPGVPVNSLLFDPSWPAYLYAATDAGVFLSLDGGSGGTSEAWYGVGAGLPNTTVFQIKLSSGSNRELVAATHGRGAWEIAALAPPTASPTVSPSFSQSPTFTVSPTISQTFTATSTVTASPTVTPDFSPSDTPTISPTFTVSPTSSSTGTETTSPTSTRTASPTATGSATASFTASPTATVVLASFAILEARIFPDPNQGGLMRLSYLLPSGADQVGIRLYDTALELVAAVPSLPNNPGVNVYLWIPSRNGLAGGIYFFEMDAVQGGDKTRVFGKMAVVN
jgi:hypothetical protein